MGELTRGIGALIVFLAALLSVRLYRSYLDGRLTEGRAFLRLIERVRDGVNCYLTPIPNILEAASELHSAILSLWKRVADGATPSEAYEVVEGELSLDSVSREILRRFFDGLGSGYREGVVAFAEECRGELSERLDMLEAEDEKNKKIYSALIVGGALGFILLFV